MKFITLVLSALMVFGVVTANLVPTCYENGKNPTPDCNLGRPCKVTLGSLLIGETKKRLDQCLASKSIIKVSCADKLLDMIDSCDDLLVKLLKKPVVEV